MPALAHQHSMHAPLYQGAPSLSHPTASSFLLLFTLALSVAACQPDESPLKAENEALRKQADKQESVIVSLQEGNRVMQQQIDLVSKELREAKQQVERVMGERTALTTQLDEQEGKARKLAADAQRVADRVAQLSNAVRVDDKGAASEDVPAPLLAVIRALEDALSKNGYGIRVGIKTEQKAVYVTDRKVSEPTSLEVPGFRNQYVLFLQSVAPARTHLSVKAEFERMAQGHRILPAGAEEAAEIERRLIAEISKSLSRAGKT
jgi:hypothetical protein